MKLRQLQCLLEVCNQDFNISSAARVLKTTQPAVSKQIQTLESDLGVKLFSRQGKRLTSLTPPGEEILKRVDEIIAQTAAIENIAREAQDEAIGSLKIATTHTQARYVLPDPIRQFRRRFPSVSLHVNQGTPEQLAELTSSGQVDFAIATEGLEFFEDLIMIPCYDWNRSVVVPEGHPFAKAGETLKIEQLAEEPLVTYVFGFESESRIAAAFSAADVEPNVVFTATDTDVIKTYVREGLGIGIIASMAFDSERDQDLIALDASHLFENSTTHIGFRKGIFLRSYMLHFIELFSPNLKQKLISAVLSAPSADERGRLLDGQEIPYR